jgi:peptidoglycan/xylan/chitin deacetylase (PgdA/CDA1 family)
MKICLKLHGLGVPPTGSVADERCFWTGEDRFAQIIDLAARVPGRVHLTFDDGNDSDANIALPALQKAGLKASFFFSTDFIGTPGYADEEDIRRLHAAGMEIGSHGCRHVSWLDMSGDEITEDVIRSFARLGTILGESVNVVAAPYGDCNLRVVRILRMLGVKRVYTSFPGPSFDGDWLARRQCITADTPMDTVERWLTKKYGMLDIICSTVSDARHVLHAVLWRV